MVFLGDACGSAGFEASGWYAYAMLFTSFCAVLIAGATYVIVKRQQASADRQLALSEKNLSIAQESVDFFKRPHVVLIDARHDADVGCNEGVVLLCINWSAQGIVIHRPTDIQLKKRHVDGLQEDQECIKVEGPGEAGDLGMEVDGAIVDSRRQQWPLTIQRSLKFMIRTVTGGCDVLRLSEAGVEFDLSVKLCYMYRGQPHVAEKVLRCKVVRP